MTLKVLVPHLDLVKTLEQICACQVSHRLALHEKVLLDFPVSFSPAQHQALVRLAKQIKFDFAWVNKTLRLHNFKILASDMDSTLITIETLDEIADTVGGKPEIAVITAAAMRGEISDYSQSLRERVSLLQGVSAQVLEEVYEHKLRLHAGAETLLSTCKAAGLATLLVSGGFDFFTKRLQKRLDFDAVLSNRLEIVDGKLTGRVLGDIIDGNAKANQLIHMCQTLQCVPSQTMAIGDGSNDLPMMKCAGLAIAFGAKPAVSDYASMVIESARLDHVLAFFEPMQID